MSSSAGLRWGGLEAVDRPGVLEDLDPGCGERFADGGGDVFVLAGEDPRRGLEQRHV